MIKDEIREVEAFRLTIERDKLARDEKNIQKIFEVLEECRIPCECMALNIDSLAVAIRKSEQDKLDGFILRLERVLGGCRVVIEEDIALLCVESDRIRGRGIGMIISSLSLQNIEVRMQRYLKCRNLFVVCVSVDMVEKTREIITEVLGMGSPAE